MSDAISPFIPGARVAVTDYHGDGCREDFVEKVYKTGRFTLRGSKQQWRPQEPSRYDLPWRARETKPGFISSRRYLTIWDATTDAQFVEARKRSVRQNRWHALSARIRRISHERCTDEMLDQIEAALDLVAPKAKAA